MLISMNIQDIDFFQFFDKLKNKLQDIKLAFHLNKLFKFVFIQLINFNLAIEINFIDFLFISNDHLNKSFILI